MIQNCSYLINHLSFWLFIADTCLDGCETCLSTQINWKILVESTRFSDSGGKLKGIEILGTSFAVASIFAATS